MAEQHSNTTQPAVSTADAEAIAFRLKHVFDRVVEVLTSDEGGRIWVVYGVAGGGPPHTEAIATRDDLFELIGRLRARHNSEPQNCYYLHIFFGQRWQIQKGRVWKLWDGRTLESIATGQPEEILDDSGTLGESAVDLDLVLPEDEETGPEPASEEADEESTEPRNVQTDPPLLGGDSMMVNIDSE